jgi:hypothetical protein
MKYFLIVKRNLLNYSTLNHIINQLNNKAK